MKTLLLSAALLCLVAAGAQSATPKTLQWFGSEMQGGTPTTDWMDGSAWGDEFTGPPLVHGSVPTALDSVKINLEWGNPGPVVDEAVAAGEIKISEKSLDPLLQSLTVAAGGSVVTGTPGYDPILNPTGYSGQVILGYYTGNVGALIMDGGTMDITSNFWAGYAGKGILQMNSGTLNVHQYFGPGWNGGTAEIHLDGGVLHTAMWWGGIDSIHLAWNNYTFDITGGTWQLEGFWLDQMQQLIDDGKLTGYGSSDNIVVTWDEDNEQTVVTAIPEPISIALLGLGALLIRKRS
jgi:hypothetical protein